MTRIYQRRLTALIAAVLLTFSWQHAQAVVATSTYVTATTVMTNDAGNQWVEFNLEPEGVVEVVPFAPDVVRVRFHFGSLFEREELAIDKPFSNWPAFSQTFSQPSPTNYLIETEKLTVSITLSNTFQVHFYNTNGVLLLEDVRMEYDQDYAPLFDTNGYEQVNWPGESSSVSNLPSGFKLKSVKRMSENEVFFGLGDSGGPLRRNGRAYQFWGQDTYQFGEYRNPKYSALPMLYGVKPPESNTPALAYGLFFNNPVRPVFKLYGTNDTWTFEAGDDQLDYFFFGGGETHTMRGVVDRFSELTGRPVFLPKWALGYHQSRHSYFTQDRVLEVATGMRTNDFPCDAIYLDIGSQASFLNGETNTFDSSRQNGQLTFNADYDDVAGLVSNTAALGIKLVPLIEPLLTTNDPLYAEAFSNLFFIKNNDLSTYVGTNFLGRISWLDFSISQTVDWWTGKLTNYMAAHGFDSIWNDLNEPNENAMPLNAIWFLDGRYDPTNMVGLVTNDSRKWLSNNKNTYNILESRVSYNALKAQYPERRPFVLSRGAWPGVQKYAAGWSGDNKAEFDHLRFNQTFGLNVMLSGQAWYGHDVGGFVNNTSKQLLGRWLQAGALSPLFRNHTTLGTDDAEPWLFGKTETLWNRKWIKFRYEMMPYLYSLAAASTTSGVPMNVPTVFYFPHDTNTYYHNDTEYMVGRDLLAAPVYVSNDFYRTVYLPDGEDWYHWDTEQRFEGGVSVTVPAYLGTLPLFSRAGAILARGPVQYYANEFVPEYLDILHWPGGTNTFTLYEDDGETTNYLAGVFARTAMTSSSDTNALNFTIAEREGLYGVGARDYYLIVYDLNPVTSVSVNSAAVVRVANRSEAAEAGGASWSYSLHERKLTVKVPDTGLHTVIEAGFVPWADADGDGLPDDWEVLFYGGVTNADASVDSDGDGLDSLDEFGGGTHPFISDDHTSVYSNMAVAGTFNLWNQQADNMLLVTNNTWALVADLSGQTNIEFKFVANNDWGQGNWGELGQTVFEPPLIDHDANVIGSNIKLNGAYTGIYTFVFNETNLQFSVLPGEDSDIDGDGIADDWEMYYGNNPYSAADAAVDTDDDAFTELQEFVAGTSPVAESANPALTAILPSSEVVWQAAAGRTYRVLYSTNLFLPLDWTVLEPFTNITGEGEVSVTDTSTLPFKAYRLDVSKP